MFYVSDVQDLIPFLEEIKERNKDIWHAGLQGIEEFSLPWFFAIGVGPSPIHADVWIYDTSEYMIVL